VAGLQVEAFEYSSREKWLELRRADITASEAGVLFGQHKYMSLRKLALEKAYGENRPQTAAMRRGRIMEPSVAEAVSVDFGWQLRRCSNYLRGRSAADPYLRVGATRDYVIPRLYRDDFMRGGFGPQAEALGWDRHESIDLALECKSVEPFVWESEWGEHPPKYILVQAAMQAALSGAVGTVVACLLENRTRDLFLYAVPRSPKFEAELFERISDFWRRFEAGEEFAVVANDNAEMAAAYPQADTDMVVDLTGEADEWLALADERARLKLDIEKRKTRIDEIEARFKDRLRGAYKAILPGWSITWKTDSGGVRRFKCDKDSASAKARRRNGR
jgi:predicted phage-related endonuclease